MNDFFVHGPIESIECIVEENKSNEKKILIMSHGFRGSRESGGYAKEIAVKASAFADVIRYNFTGTQILSLQVDELLAVIRHVKRENPDAKIFLLGRSMGGAASIIASAQEEVEGLILWSTPNDLRVTFKNCMPEEEYADLNAGKMIHLCDERGCTLIFPEFLTDLDKYDLSALLKSWQGRPVLLFHGEADDIVSVEQGRRNASILGESCEAYFVPEGDHHLQNFSEQAGTIIARWLSER